jgi:hypothetical protein
MKLILLTFFAILTFCVTAPVSSIAGDRPADSWKVIRRAASPEICMDFARRELASLKYTVFHEERLFVLAGRDDSVVEVVCAPEKDGFTYVVVSAFSMDEKISEAARNGVGDAVANGQGPQRID